MIGNQERWQEDLFVAGPLSSLIPEDHILKQVDKVIDLSWLRSEVKDTYSRTMGRPSIDPESALRLMLAGYFQGIVRASLFTFSISKSIAAPYSSKSTLFIKSTLNFTEMDTWLTCIIASGMRNRIICALRQQQPQINKFIIIDGAVSTSKNIMQNYLCK